VRKLATSFEPIIWKVVRLVWFSITAVSFMAGFFAYKTTVEELGHWIALGCER
jgi:hypothetical protein